MAEQLWGLDLEQWALWWLLHQQERQAMGSGRPCGGAMRYVVELYFLMAGYCLGHWHWEYWSLFNCMNYESAAVMHWVSVSAVDIRTSQ